VVAIGHAAWRRDGTPGKPGFLRSKKCAQISVDSLYLHAVKLVVQQGFIFVIDNFFVKEYAV
jgi:hypothetical protein